MHVFRLLWGGSFQGLVAALPSTLLAGLSNTILIWLINSAATHAALGERIGLHLFLMYLVAFGVFYTSERLSLRAANALVQRRLAELHLRLADKVRTVELRTIERLGHGRLLATIGQETNHLAQTFPLLVSAGQGLVLLLFCLLYLALLSFPSFLVIAGVTGLALVLFGLGRARLRRSMSEVHLLEAAMLDAVGSVVNGFQEIRLNADRNDGLYAHFVQVIDRLQSTVVGIGRIWSALLMFSNAFLYALVGIVVFVLPMFFAGYTDVIFKIAAIAIFSVGPVNAVTSVAPLFDRANAGLQHVFALERLLDGDAAAPMPAQATGQFDRFDRITLDAACFGFDPVAGASGFGVGPLDLDLRRGELLFLVGGNGSGKSTTLKLLCGLYPPSAGRILVDGIPVRPDSLQAYRELFSCIFTDFHLFARPYGLEGADPAEVAALLLRLGLQDKVTFVDGAFSTQALSTGQRKRLAMVVALLEDRPIMVLDEWAADQDAHYRHMFYTELLPELRRRGKTVIAVTHDDRYWPVADRRIVLDLGRVRVSANGSSEPR